jgi:hypothetical protein
MTGETRLMEEQSNCPYCNRYRGYVCAEHREPSYAELLTKVKELQAELAVAHTNNQQSIVTHRDATRLWRERAEQQRWEIERRHLPP